MTLTSIKVSKDLRDRVSRLARRRSMSQHAYLEQLLSEAEEQEFWARMAEMDAAEHQSALEQDGDQLSEDYELEEELIESEERNV